jgi:hypothetical protein
VRSSDAHEEDAQIAQGGSMKTEIKEVAWADGDEAFSKTNPEVVLNNALPYKTPTNIPSIEGAVFMRDALAKHYGDSRLADKQMQFLFPVLEKEAAA